MTARRELLRDRCTALFVARDGKVTRSYATAMRCGGVMEVVPHGTQRFQDVALKMHVQALVGRGEV